MSVALVWRWRFRRWRPGSALLQRSRDDVAELDGIGRRTDPAAPRG